MSSNTTHNIEKDLTEKELAEILNVSVRTLQIWRANGKGPKSYRHGYKGVRYERTEVQAWKEKLKYSQEEGDL